jgi:hypothetical protein
MKKIGLLLFTVCVCLLADAQTTIDIFSTGPLGSFTTGNSSNTTRTDNNIVAQAFVRRGYAVFDLNAIPASAVVTSVELRFNVATTTGGGGTGWVTRGYLGDLSTITAAGTLYTTMGLAPQVYSSTYGTTTGNRTLPTDPLAVTFVDTNIGRTVSMIWSTGTGRTYTISHAQDATRKPFRRSLCDSFYYSRARNKDARGVASSHIAGTISGSI